MPKVVSKVDLYDVCMLGESSGLQSLQRASMATDELPLHLLMAVFADSADDIMNGNYQIATLVSGNEQEQSVTLAKKVKEGTIPYAGLRENQKRRLQTCKKQRLILAMN